MTYRLMSYVSWNATESEPCEFLFVCIRLKNFAHLSECKLIFVEHVVFNVVTGPIWGRKIYCNRKVDKPPWFQKLYKAWLLQDLEFIYFDKTPHFHLCLLVLQVSPLDFANFCVVIESLDCCSVPSVQQVIILSVYFWIYRKPDTMIHAAYS